MNKTTKITAVEEEHPGMDYQIIHTERDIRGTVKGIAAEVLEYAKPNDIFVCLLYGGVFFYSDLLREMCIQNLLGIKLVFLEAHTVTDTDGCRKVNISTFICEAPIAKAIEEGANVWIIDEIIDSGQTVTAVIDWFEGFLGPEGTYRHPEYNTIMMLERKGAQYDERVNHRITGYIENRREWFVGYGMDGTEGLMRALPMIAIERHATDNPYDIDEDDC